jgi:hypothetical protein
MIRQATTQGRRDAMALGGRADAAPGVSGPYLVMDLGRGRDPHQARCRRCCWRSDWRATAAQARAEHDRHQLAAHSRGRRPARRGRRGLVVRKRAQ